MVAHCFNSMLLCVGTCSLHSAYLLKPPTKSERVASYQVLPLALQKPDRHRSKDASADFVYSKDAWCYMPDKQQIIDQAARIVKPGGKVMFTDWIEGEGLSDPEAQRFLSLMTFPAIPTVEEYAQMLKKAGFEVEIAENSGRFSPAMNSYVHMLKRQAVYDAKKLLGWDEGAYDKLISDFEFMAKLAREGKIIQGMFVGRKKDVHREM